MNKSIKALIVFLCVLCGMIVMLSCEKNTAINTAELAITEPLKKESLPTQTKLTKEFKDYWYAGNAEITSCKLEQARYG